MIFLFFEIYTVPPLAVGDIRSIPDIEIRPHNGRNRLLTIML